MFGFMTCIINTTTKPNQITPYKQPSHRVIFICFTTLTPFKIGLYRFLHQLIFSDLLSVEHACWRSLNVPDVASTPSSIVSSPPQNAGLSLKHQFSDRTESFAPDCVSQGKQSKKTPRSRTKQKQNKSMVVFP